MNPMCVRRSAFILIRLWDTQSLARHRIIVIHRAISVSIVAIHVKKPEMPAATLLRRHRINQNDIEALCMLGIYFFCLLHSQCNFGLMVKWNP